MTNNLQIFLFDKKEETRQKRLLARTIKIRFDNCRRGAAIRFVRWCKAAHPEDKISGSLISRIIAKNGANSQSVSLQKMELVQERMKEFFQKIEEELSQIKALVPENELEKVRLYKVN